VHHRDGSDPDNSIVEDDNRNLGLALSRRWEGDVDSPDECARVRHLSVQRHDVQMVGLAGEDVSTKSVVPGAGSSGWIVVSRRKVASPVGSVSGRGGPST
jgi:hypothetical protein